MHVQVRHGALFVYIVFFVFVLGFIDGDVYSRPRISS